MICGISNKLKHRLHMLTTAPSRWPRVKAKKSRSIDSIMQQVEVKLYILPKTSSLTRYVQVHRL